MPSSPPHGSRPPPTPTFSRGEDPPGWSGAVIAPLRAYPFLNFLGFKIWPCEEGPARDRWPLSPINGAKSGHSLTAASCHKATSSPNGCYGIFGQDRADHSALILAARMTLPHFSVSSARSLPKSVDVIGRGTVPRSASRAFILGSARAALISLLSRSMISAGTF